MVAESRAAMRSLRALVVVATSAVTVWIPPAAANAPLTSVTAVTAGIGHACALRSDNTVYCWGNNSSRELGRSTDGRAAAPVEGLPVGVTRIESGDARSCAITSQGTIYCWGSFVWPTVVAGQPGPAAGVASAIGHQCLVLSAEGATYCWGDNSFGELGNGTQVPSPTPVPVSGLSSGVTAIDLGASFSCAIVAGGVKCWGRNYTGQLGDGTTQDRHAPTPVVGLSSGVAAFSVGFAHACVATTAGAVKCWGNNVAGQLGDGTFATRTSPVNVSTLTSGFVKVAAGGGHSCAVRNDGAVLCWGSNAYGELGDETFTSRLVPAPVLGLAGPAVDVVAGTAFTCVLLASGQPQCFGSNSGGQLGINSLPMRRLPVGVVGLESGTAQIASSAEHSCATNAGGAAFCWGSNDDGQLGDGTINRRVVPVAVQALATETARISAGANHSCARTSAGTALCWGSNFDGALGDGTLEPRLTPVAVNGLAAWVSHIAAGYGHTCAVQGGAAKCWGTNYAGQLGDGTTTRSLVPLTVSNLGSGVASVAAGSGRSCALRTNGGVKCWGWAVLGDGTGASSAQPVDVLGLNSGAKAVALGALHTCAIDAGGGARCWGHNNEGQLGDGSAMIRLAPVPVSGLGTNVVRIAAGGSHSCALLGTGELRCWGSNAVGQLGSAQPFHAYEPVPVILPEPAVDVATGSNHTCVVLASGAAKCFGATYAAQLGSGDTDRSAEPRYPVLADFSTSISLVSAPRPSNFGDLVTLTVTVTGPDTLPSPGFVQFEDGGKPLPCTSFLSGAVATCQLFPTPGIHRFTARFSGDTDHVPAMAAISHVVNPVAGQHCSGFDDVDATHPFCRHVDWLRNRGITLGCGAFDFCPGDTVSRLSMAAFMNRLGRAMSPEAGYTTALRSFYVAFQSDDCDTPPIPHADYPRRAFVDAVVSLGAPQNAEIGVQIVSGPWLQFTPIGDMHRLFIPDSRDSSLRMSAVVDIPAGSGPAFALRFQRLASGPDFVSGACTVRGMIINRDETFAPFDAGN